MAGHAEVRRVRPEEWEELRSLRLRALADTPAAFGRSLVEEEGRPPDEWKAMARAPVFVAVRDGAWLGMTGCFIEAPAGPAVIWGMWVTPEARREGIGGRLLTAALEWAVAEGPTAVRLWVSEGNTAAAELYRRAGFAPTGRAKALPSDASRTEIELELET
ncbi:MAG: GNAT family N-acetyltransferase [Actinomycetota bacterium]